MIKMKIRAIIKVAGEHLPWNKPICQGPGFTREELIRISLWVEHRYQHFLNVASDCNIQPMYTALGPEASETLGKHSTHVLTTHIYIRNGILKKRF